MRIRNFLAVTFIGGPLHTQCRRLPNGTDSLQYRSALYHVAPSNMGPDGHVDPSRDHLYFTLTSWNHPELDLQGAH